MSQPISIEVTRTPGRLQLFRYTVCPKVLVSGIIWRPMIEYLDVFITRRGAERYAQELTEKFMSINSHPSGKGLT